MNKKLFLLAAAAVAASLCAFGLAACGHTHDMAYHAAASATCTEDGNVEYWYCRGCNKYFADEDGKEQLEGGDVVIKATGHSWDEGEITTEPTCAEEGEKTFTCTVCKQTKTESIGKGPHTYSLEWSSDKTHHWHAATCEHSDQVADRAEHTWDEGVCSVCGKLRTENL